VGCPDCEANPFVFYEGPSGGCNVNVCCENPLCRSAFNITPMCDWVERISNLSFRSAFPECPEESEGYLRFQINKDLTKESTEFIEDLTSKN